VNFGSEAANRTAKVLRLIEVTPLGTDARTNADVVEMLAAATPAQRAKYAADAGCSAPSETTWRLFVEAMRQRIARANGNAGRDPADAITRGG
jgi:hypothetical protein